MKNLLIRAKKLVVRHWKLLAAAIAAALVIKECL
jgi:hypothetical protein